MGHSITGLDQIPATEALLAFQTEKKDASHRPSSLEPLTPPPLAEPQETSDMTNLASGPPRDPSPEFSVLALLGATLNQQLPWVLQTCPQFQLG